MPNIRMKTLAIFIAVIVIPVLIWILISGLRRGDERKLRGIINDMTQAAADLDADGMVRHLALDYDYRGFTRDDLRRMAEAYFEQFGETSITITSFNSNISGNIATVDIIFLARNRQFESVGLRTLNVRWQFSFVKSNDRWQIRSMDPVAIGQTEFEDWTPIARRLGILPSGRTDRP